MELKTQLIKICCEGCEDKSCNENCPDYKYIELVLAEFDQLTAEKAEIEASRQAYIKILDETMLENEVLQSHLDTICEPIKKGRYEGGSGWTESNATWKLVCDYLNSQEDSSTKSRGAIEASAAEPAYANQRQPNPKPSEKHNPSNEDEGTHEGNWRDCPICNPPITQCPECIWGQKIVYVNGYIVPVFVEGRWDKQDWVCERCPRCRGEGRIPC